MNPQSYAIQATKWKKCQPSLWSSDFSLARDLIFRECDIAGKNSFNSLKS